MTVEGRAQPLYAERLTPPWWLLALLAVAAANVALFLLIVLPPAGLLADAGTVFTAGAALLIATTPRVVVTPTELRAGRARIPVALLGAATALDPAAARHLRGPGIDARAYHVLRGWVPGAVRVDVVDPQDPTPYWFISSRRPERLAEAIEQAHSAGARP